MGILNPRYDPELGKRTEKEYNRIKAIFSGRSPAHNCDQHAQRILKAATKLSAVVTFADEVVRATTEKTPENNSVAVEMIEDFKLRDRAGDSAVELQISFLGAVASYLEINKAKYEQQKQYAAEPVRLKREKREAEA